MWRMRRELIWSCDAWGRKQRGHPSQQSTWKRKWIATVPVLQLGYQHAVTSQVQWLLKWTWSIVIGGRHVSRHTCQLHVFDRRYVQICIDVLEPGVSASVPFLFAGGSTSTPWSNPVLMLEIWNELSIGFNICQSCASNKTPKVSGNWWRQDLKAGHENAPSDWAPDPRLQAKLVTYGKQRTCLIGSCEYDLDKACYDWLMLFEQTLE